MSAWIWLNPSRITRVRTEKDRGILQVSMPSPYDLPRAVRGQLDASGKAFLVEFLYMDSEPTTTQQLRPNVWARLGQNTRRVYALTFQIDETTSKTLRDTLSQETLDTEWPSDASPRWQNYEA